MPPSPSIVQEIQIANDQGKPLLIFLEDSVNMHGFIPSQCTYLRFNRDSALADPFSTFTGSLLDYRDGILEESETIRESISGFKSSSLRVKMKCIVDRDGLIWRRETTEVIRYVGKNADGPLIKEVKCDLLKPDNMPHSEYLSLSYSIDSPSETGKFEEELIRQPDGAVLFLRPLPTMRIGDEFTLNMVSESRYYTFRKASEIPSDATAYGLNGMVFHVIDRQAVTRPTQFLEIEVDFDKRYGVSPSDVCPVAGILRETNKLVIANAAEIDRCDTSTREFAGSFITKLSINKPIMHYQYGFAWNLD